MVFRSAFRASQLRACGVALTVAFVAGLVTSSEAAPAPKAPPAPRSSQTKSPTSAGQSALDQAKRLIDAEQPEAAAVMLRRFIEGGPPPELLDDAYLLMAAAMFGMKEQAETIRYINQLTRRISYVGIGRSSETPSRQNPCPVPATSIWLCRCFPKSAACTSDPNTKREALRLTGEFQAQKKDFTSSHSSVARRDSRWIPGNRRAKPRDRFGNWSMKSWMSRR